MNYSDFSMTHQSQGLLFLFYRHLDRSRNHATSRRRRSSAVSETRSRSVTAVTAVVTVVTAVTCTTVQLPLVDDRRETRRRR